MYVVLLSFDAHFYHTTYCIKCGVCYSNSVYLSVCHTLVINVGYIIS